MDANELQQEVETAKDVLLKYVIEHTKGPPDAKGEPTVRQGSELSREELLEVVSLQAEVLEAYARLDMHMRRGGALPSVWADE